MTPPMVKETLDDAGLRGTFHFVCVPCIPSGRSNLGYAFVGFSSAEHAQECRRQFHGRVFGRTFSSKLCVVEPASEEKDAKALVTWAAVSATAGSSASSSATRRRTMRGPRRGDASHRGAGTHAPGRPHDVGAAGEGRGAGRRLADDRVPRRARHIAVGAAAVLQPRRARRLGAGAAGPEHGAVLGVFACGIPSQFQYPPLVGDDARCEHLGRERRTAAPLAAGPRHGRAAFLMWSASGGL
eukprot:CAMPEP_0176004032 /NCGR_PEP_ID=MMETSP0120_2-20121206/1480_1 /TAXON_ID=160619 /ORGANISM="Kryptoperidinium foliaceum, Strain CCMP 1326" /LENGTH=240 /DNA_ID=CAMNT_0017336693 /DNA_START=14 /DNA_END=734 /DNA_ORIENTATION=+